MISLQINNLTLKYGRHHVFKNLSFTLDKGDFLCIVGPNGSGKTTLIKCILGEVKPTSGSIKIGINSHNEKIGYLPQNTNYIPNYIPSDLYSVIIKSLELYRPFKVFLGNYYFI